MTPADFDVQFGRLTAHFRLPTDANRDALALDWLHAVEAWPPEALERAVTDLIRAAQDRFWPPLGTLLSLLRARRDRTDALRCATCHGSGWVDTLPYWSHGLVYDHVVQRCGACGIPPPVYTEPHGRRPLTAAEFQQWRRGEHRQQMPEGLRAKVSAA